MTRTHTLEALLRRDHVIVGTALFVLVALAWIYVIALSFAMPLSASGAMSRVAMTEAFRPWSVAQFALAFGMWSAMTVGMMTPSVAPAILAYARLSEHPVARREPLAPIGWFIAGYLFVWLGYAFIATVLQAGLLRTGLIAANLRSASAIFGGLVLLVAGLYQLSRLKQSCLLYCRSPLVFIHDQGGFKPSVGSALALGLKHGAYCVLCCWALMAILFVVGVMDLLWIAVISIWVLVEKLFSSSVMTRFSGVVLILTGVAILMRTAI